MNNKSQSIKLTSIAVIVMVSLINSSCSKFKNRSLAKTKTNIINNNYKHNVNNDIGVQLVSSAKLIEKSLATLAASQEINNIPVLNTAPLITQEGGMGGTADIDWTGPIEPLLENIANMTNYSLKIMGNAPPIPIIVSVTQERAIVADILKNACLQVGKRANIIVFPANKIIELRYRFGPLMPDPTDLAQTTTTISKKNITKQHND